MECVALHVGSGIKERLCAGSNGCILRLYVSI